MPSRWWQLTLPRLPGGEDVVERGGELPARVVQRRTNLLRVRKREAELSAAAPKR